jgi:hypothetical protein
LQSQPLPLVSASNNVGTEQNAYWKEDLFPVLIQAMGCESASLHHHSVSVFHEHLRWPMALFETLFLGAKAYTNPPKEVGENESSHSGTAEKRWVMTSYKSEDGQNAEESQMG